jgi:hypothetical protein
MGWSIAAARRFIAMFRAFFDDSGTHDGAPVVIVGGVVGKDEQWDLFNDLWRSVIAKRSLPYFHTTKFKVAKDAPYSTLCDAEKTTLLDQLLLTLRARASLVVSSAISASSYDAVLTQEQKLRYGDPFHLAAQLCWLGIKLWADKHEYNDPIPFVIEGGTKREKGLQVVFDKLLANPKMKALLRLDSLTLGTKEKFPALQAADIIANSTYESDGFRTGGREPTKWLYQINDRLKPVAYRHILPTEEALREWIGTMDEHYVRIGKI